MTKRQRDLLCSVLFLGFGIFVFVQSLPIQPIMEKDLGSGFMPRVVAVAIIAVAALKLVLSLLDKEAGAEKRERSGDLKGGIATILALTGYAVLFDTLGFILATALYLFAQIFILSGKEHRNIKVTILISVVAPVVIYALFVYAIKMPLPTGILSF